MFVDLVFPFGAGSDPAVVPEPNTAFTFQCAQMFAQLLAQLIISMRVGDKNLHRLKLFLDGVNLSLLDLRNGRLQGQKSFMSSSLIYTNFDNQRSRVANLTTYIVVATLYSGFNRLLREG